jgi:hypothetical protein
VACIHGKDPIRYQRLPMIVLFILTLLFMIAHTAHYIHGAGLPFSPVIEAILFGLLASSFIGAAFAVAGAGRPVIVISCVSGGLFLLNLIFIQLGGAPRVDVYTLLTEGAQCILRPENPFTHHYTQIYSPNEVAAFYYNDPRFLSHVPLNPYPPLTLFHATFGSLCGDVRISSAVMLFLLPYLFWIIVTCATPNLPRAASLLLALLPVLNPAQIDLLYCAYTDLAVAFCFTLFFAMHLLGKKVASYIALAFVLGLKQYSVIFFFPFLFILNLRDLRLWIVNDLRHSRRLVVCEPLKAVVNLGPPQRWQLFP